MREDDEEWGDEARSLELARDQWTGWGVETTSMRRRMVSALGDAGTGRRRRRRRRRGVAAAVDTIELTPLTSRVVPTFDRDEQLAIGWQEKPRAPLLD